MTYSMLRIYFLLISVLVGFFPALQSTARAEPNLKLKVGLIQFPISKPTTESAFLIKVEESVVDARKKGANLVVLPELLVLDQVTYGDVSKEKVQIERLATEFYPRYVLFLQNLAKRENISLLGGSAPRKVKDSIRNTAIFFLKGRTGPVLQDKLFLTPEEKAWGWVGGSELNVIETEFGNWATLICYDAQFAGLSHLLGPAAPTLILVPSMTTREGLARVRFAAQARAVEHHAFVLVSGVVSGKAPEDLDYVGQNVAIPPQEKGYPPVIAEGPYNRPSLTLFELDFSRLIQSKKTTGIYSARDYGSSSRGKDLVLKVIPRN